MSLGDKSVAATTWNLHYLGAGAQTSMGEVTRGLTYTAMTLRPYYYPGTPGKFDYSPRTVTVSVFPWTTGTAQVTALTGPQVTVLERAGYDNRTPNGAGTIQMVSPMLARWTNSFGDFHTGSIGVLKLQFVPEPGAWSMLAAGSAALGLLYRALLSRLLHDYRLPLKSAYTEAEVLRLVHTLEQQPLSQFSQVLTLHWQNLAYGHRLPPETLKPALCQDWRNLFGPGVQA